MVATSDFLAIAEGLHHLDPVRTYPRRAAKLVADLAGASAYRVQLDRDADEVVESVPPPPDVSSGCTAIPLRHGRHQLGTLYLYNTSANKLEGSELRLARWGARALARGLAYASRMSSGSEPRRRGSDIQHRLDRTPLTPREKEVVSLLVSGQGTRQIAGHTTLTVATVHTYLKRIYSKLGVHSRVELMARMTGTVGSALSADEPTFEVGAVDDERRLDLLDLQSADDEAELRVARAL